MNKIYLKKLDRLLNNTGDMALKRRAKRIVTTLNPQKGEKIIDIGCGDGYYLYLLSNLDMKLRLTGTDYDIKGLTNAKKNLDPKIPLKQGDLMKRLPFADNTFDKAVMSEVAEHLPNDVKGLKEVYRILKPGGTLCLTVPDARYPILWDPINWMLDRTTKKHIQSGFWAGIWNQHIRLYKRETIVKVVEKAGFEVQDSTAVTAWSLPFNHHIVNLVARSLASGRLSTSTSASLSKYEKRKKKPLFFSLAFRFVNALDKLNDIYQPKEIGVSIFVAAIKPQ